MKKKVLAVLMAAAFVLAMAGCRVSSSAAKPAEKPVEKSGTGTEEKKSEKDKGTDAAKAVGADTAAAAATEHVGAGTAATAAAAYNEPIPVMSYKEFAVAEIGAPVTVETYVQAKQSYDEEKSTATLYTQNEEGAYFIESLPITQADYKRLVEGQKIKISGSKSEKQGEVGIIDATYEIQDGKKIAEAKDVTDLLGTDELADYQNRKVVFKGLKTVDTEDVGGDLLRFFYGTDGNGDRGDDLYFSAEKEGKTYLFTVEADLCGPDTDVYKTVESIDEDVIVDIEGFMCWDEGPIPHVTGITAH